METSATKKTLLCIFTAILGLLSIVSLAFTVNYAVDFDYVNLGYGYGYNEIDKIWNENGFTYLGGSEFLSGKFSGAGAVVSIICYLLLFGGIGALVLAILTFFTNFRKQFILTIFNTTIFILSFLYMLAGIIVVSVTEFDAYTLSYIPFILILGAYIPYIIFAFKAKREVSYVNTNSKNTTSAKYVTTGVSLSQQREIAISEGAKIGALYSVKGAVGKSLVVYENKCVINTKTTVRSVIAGNFTDGEKTIFYTDLTGIQFKRCNSLLLGYLQFETASTGANRSNGNWAKNYESENSFTFEANMNDLMEEISKYVKRRLEEIKENKPAQNTTVIEQKTSSAEELLKFKQLLDAGVITQEEFNKKKQELLG